MPFDLGFPKLCNTRQSFHPLKVKLIKIESNRNEGAGLDWSEPKPKDNINSIKLTFN